MANKSSPNECSNCGNQISQKAKFCENCGEKISDSQQSEADKAWYRKDYETAVKLWREEAQAGDADAAWRLAGAIARGLGMPEDKTKAQRWIEIAGKLEHPEAMMVLAKQCEGLRDYGAADDWYIKASLKGVAEASYRSGMMRLGGYNPGKHPHSELLELAVYDIKSSAERGSAEAQYQLAKFYDHGLDDKHRHRVIGPDKKKAIEWYSKAAKQGHPEALRLFP